MNPAEDIDAYWLPSSEIVASSEIAVHLGFGSDEVGDHKMLEADVPVDPGPIEAAPHESRGAG